MGSKSFVELVEQSEEPLGGGAFIWSSDRVEEGFLGPLTLLVRGIGLGVSDLAPAGERDQDRDSAVPVLGQLQCGHTYIVAGGEVEIFDETTHCRPAPALQWLRRGGSGNRPFSSPTRSMP